MKGYQPQGRLLGLFVSRVFKLAMLGMFMAFWIVACSGGMTHDPTSVQEQFDAGASSSSAQCQVIQHDVGETEVCGQPEKLVALGPNMLEILLVLDVQPVGYADYFPLSYREFDQPDQQIPYLGERVTSQPSNVGTSGDPSLEAIVKLKPDLILGNSESNQDEYALLSQIAPTLLFHYGTNGEWQQHIQTVAKVLDRSEQAESVIADHTQKVAQMRESLQPIANAYPRMLLLGSDQLEQNLQIDPYNHKSYCSSLVEDLGFELVLPSDIGKQALIADNVSLEILPQLDADLIVIQGWNSNFNDVGEDLIDHQLKNVKRQWTSNAIAQSLDASKAGRVYFTSAYLCRALPGPIGAKIFLVVLHQQLRGEP